MHLKCSYRYAFLINLTFNWSMVDLPPPLRRVALWTRTIQEKKKKKLKCTAKYSDIFGTHNIGEMFLVYLCK